MDSVECHLKLQMRRGAEARGGHPTRAEAVHDFFHGIEKYHNRLRRPSSLGKKTPVDLENQRH